MKEMAVLLKPPVSIQCMNLSEMHTIENGNESLSRAAVQSKKYGWCHAPARTKRHEGGGGRTNMKLITYQWLGNPALSRKHPTRAYPTHPLR